jgi:hypothetical protein
MPFKLSDLYRNAAGAFDPAKAATSAGLAALAYGALKPDSGIGEFIGGKKQQPVGYTGGIPEYGVNRTLLPNAFATTTPTGAPRVPGSGGRRYFSDMTYTPTGDTMSAAINPVNVPVTTRPRAGVLDTLSAEEAQFLLEKLFSGQGISNLGTPVAAAPVAAAPVAAAPVAAAPVAAAPVAAAPVAVKPAVVTPAVVTPAAPKFTNAEVKDALDALINQYKDDNEGLTRAVAQAIKASGVGIEDAAQQISKIYRPDVKDLSKGFTPQQIIDTYKQLGFAQGGLASLPQSRGYYLGGTTDGMADQIPANINGQQEAALSDGEFVIPADVVSHLGNGNSDAGAKQLYAMMDRVRQARTGTKEQGRKITPNKFTPA